MNVVVTGSLGYDYIMNFTGRFADRIMPDQIHNISLSFLADKLNKQFGGTAGNFAYTAKLLGLEPYIVSTAGNDFAPYKAFLRLHKISVTYIHIHPHDVTGSYFVVTDSGDNQIGTFYVGAMKHNIGLSIRDVKKKIDFVHIAPQSPDAMAKTVRECIDAKIPYMYDPAFQIGSIPENELREGIAGSAICIGNDYEMELMKDKLGISRDELLLMTPVVVSTIGSKGSIIQTRKESIHIQPAKAKNTKDPTGAGDAYRAGFIAGYLRGYDLAMCGKMGSIAAVYTVEQYGTVTHMFTKKDFINRYTLNYGETIPL